MSDALPVSVNAFRLVDILAKVEGSISVEDLPRLRDRLSTDNGTIDVILQFGRNPHGPAHIIGTVNASLDLLCQRCSEGLDYNISVELCVSPVTSDIKAAKLPAGFEPVLTEDGRISLVDLVEEELLLSLPMMAKHKMGECTQSLPYEIE
jgi:uncharacterized protein